MKNRFGVASSICLALALAVLAGCGNGSPTSPPAPGQTPTPPIGSLTGTWTGLITYTGTPSPSGVPCPANEVITVLVSETGDGQVSASFSSGCYGTATFVGHASTSALTGQLRIHQSTCREEGGYVDAVGDSSGSFDTSHIRLQTLVLGTADCAFGGDVIDIHR